jgi:hypothetical protein
MDEVLQSRGVTGQEADVAKVCQWFDVVVLGLCHEIAAARVERVPRHRPAATGSAEGGALGSSECPCANACAAE